MLEKEEWSSCGKGNLSKAASISLMRSKSGLLSAPGFLRYVSDVSLTKKGARQRAVLLFPDVPAGADAHCRQTLLQRGCPDVAVQMHAKYQGVAVNKPIGAGGINSLSTQAGEKILVWLSKAWFLIDCLDILPTF